MHFLVESLSVVGCGVPYLQCGRRASSTASIIMRLFNGFRYPSVVLGDPVVANLDALRMGNVYNDHRHHFLKMRFELRCRTHRTSWLASKVPPGPPGTCFNPTPGQRSPCTATDSPITSPKDRPAPCGMPCSRRAGALAKNVAQGPILRRNEMGPARTPVETENRTTFSSFRDVSDPTPGLLPHRPIVHRFPLTNWGSRN